MKNFKKEYQEYFNEIKLTNIQKENIYNNIIKEQNNLSYISKRKLIYISSIIILVLCLSVGCVITTTNNYKTIKYDEYFFFDYNKTNTFNVKLPINDDYKNNNKQNNNIKEIEKENNINLIESKYLNEEIIITENENNNNIIDISYKKITNFNDWKSKNNNLKTNYIRITGKFLKNDKITDTYKISTHYGEIKDNNITKKYNKNLKTNIYIYQIRKNEEHNISGVRKIYFIKNNIFYEITFNMVTDEIVWEFINSLN